MKKIAKIELQRKNSHRYSLYFEIDDQPTFAFGISEDTLIKYGLAKGQVLSDDEIEQIKKGEENSQATSFALNYLSYRMRSVKEVHEHLQKQEYSPETISRTIERLTELGYLDDLEYAHAYVKNEMNLSRKGSNAIKYELQKRGITEDHAEQALASYTTELQLENALFWSEKQVSKSNTSAKMAQQKALAQLARKGYPIEIAKEAVALASIEDITSNEWDNLCQEGFKLHRKFKNYTEPDYSHKLRNALFRKGYPYDLITKFVNCGKDAIENQELLDT